MISCRDRQRTDALLGFSASPLTLDVRGNRYEVVTLNSLCPQRGIDRASMTVAQAREGRLPPSMAGDGEDNTRALCFYQRLGLRIVTRRRDTVTRQRLRKPEIPPRGDDGIPIRDESELAIELDKECIDV